MNRTRHHFHNHRAGLRKSRPFAAFLLLAGLALACLAPFSARAEVTAENQPPGTPLTQAEKERIDAILRLPPAEAKAPMKDACRDLLGNQGDLSPLLDHLRAAGDGAQPTLMLAIASLENGDLRGAEAALDKLAADPSADAWTIAELGRIKEMRGKTTDAAALFQRALGMIRDPELRFTLVVRMAQLFYDSGKRPEAREALRSIAMPQGTPVERRNFCARIAAMNGDDSLVAEWFDPAADEKERHLDHLFLGESLLRLNQPDKARGQFETALRLAKLPRDRRHAIDRIVTTARSMNTLPQVMDDWLKSREITPEQLEIMVRILGGELGRIDDVFALIERSDLPEKTRAWIETSGFQERLAAMVSETDRSGDSLRRFRDLMASHPEEAAYRDAYVRLLLMEGDRAAAIRIYQDAIAAAGDPRKLMRIAAGARETGLTDVAIEAARKAAEAGGAAPFEAGLFTASLLREQGRTDDAVDTLRHLESGLIPGDADGVMALGEAFERIGNGADAIRLCRKALELSGSERVLRKLITLLEVNNQQDEAFVLWRQLWETAQEPMSVMQANDRLLELGSRNGKLADLAIGLEKQLSQKGLNERELTLLLDIYVSVGDPVSAADVIMELPESKDGGGIETCQRLLKVYMECELFGRCNDLLRKLIEIDPDNRDEHLQMLAVVALERRNHGDAMVVMEQLVNRTGDGILRDTFSASVLDMIGRHVEAARAYRRSLVANPDEVESWLLWGNALAARDAVERGELKEKGERPPPPEEQHGARQTRGVFSVMLENAADDDLFVLCIDGLLNARAPRHTLLNALRRLNERIAADPHNALLYQLAADLREDIGRPDEAAKVLESSLTVAGDSRPIILRELVAMATAAGRTDDVIRFGRSLLNIADHLPPEECLALATILLQRGHVPEAEIAFQQIVADPNAGGAARDVAQRYENAGLFDKAGQVIRTLMIGSPFDVELHLRLGLLEEKRGESAKAASAFSRALDLMISRQPRSSASDAAAERRTLNLDDMSLFSDLAIRGLIASAQTGKDRTELLESARDKVAAELENLDANAATGASLAENPRLSHLADVVRRLGLLLHRTDLVDGMDAALFQRYPGDAQLRADAAEARRVWLTEYDAGSFLAKHNAGNGLQAITAAFAQGRKAVEGEIRNSPLTPAERSAGIVLLSMFGYDDLIGPVLKDCDLGRTPQEDGELLVAAGIAARRPDLMREVIFTNLNRMNRELAALKGTQRFRAHLHPARLYKQIVAAWPSLSAQDRSTAANLYGMSIESGSGSSPLQASHHFLLSLAGRPREIGIERIRHYFDRGSFYLHGHVATILDRWLAAHPAAERPAAVRELLGTRSDRSRTEALTRLGGCLSPETLTDRLRAEFPELAAGARVFTDTGNTGTATDADMRGQRKDFAREIDHALKAMRGDAHSIFLLHERTLRPAADLLPRHELDLLIEPYQKSGDPVRKLVVFLLLKQAGRDVEAFAVMEDIAAMPPGNPEAETALAALSSLLPTYGWILPAMRLNQSTSTNPVRNLKLDFDRHDPLAILANDPGDMLDASARRIHATRLMPSPEQFRQAFRIYHADTRHPHVAADSGNRAKAATWPARLDAMPGGLQDIQMPQDDTILRDAVKLPAGQDELMRWLRTLTPGWSSNERLLCHQIAVDAAQNGLSPGIRQDLETAARQSSLNVFDLALIDALAREAPGTLPAALGDQMEKLALHDWRGDSRWSPVLAEARRKRGVQQDSAGRMASLVAACRSLGRPDLAAPFARWSLALDLAETGSARCLSSYLDALPAADRRQALADLLPFIGLNETRVVTGDGFADLLEQLLREGMAGEASKQVDRYLRQRLPAVPGGGESSEYRALVGAGGNDPQVQDDAVALALAKLGRPDDYRRILKRKYEDLLALKPPLGPGRNMGTMPPADITGTLPEPGEVEDAGLYLDIHVTLADQLRRKGILDAEGHVARLCMLGRWCAGRGLNDRAATLLRQAEELSADMFTGRLWVADLQRILGRDAAAEEIELSLLRQGLLPLPRVPAALDAIARSRGQAAADAAAFRLAGFTNHPDVLVRALRHARDEELKHDYLDLAERLRQVKTLFLPPGSPCPFEGFATVADWSASVSSTAAGFSETSKPRPLTALADDSDPAIARVILHGKQPAMIYVPIIRDNGYSRPPGGGKNDIRAVMENCEKIADRLYRRYGVRKALLEGLPETFVEEYNRIPPQRRNVPGDNDAAMIVRRTWNRLLAEKEWLLLSPGDEPGVGPLTALGREFEGRMIAAIENAESSGWLRNQDVYQTNKPRLEAQIKALAEDYDAKHRDLLGKDPGCESEHAITVTRCNRMLLDRLLAGDKPGVLFFDAGHWADLEKQLVARGVSHAVVVPAGVPWPPGEKDPAAIKTEMRQLGASLRKCSIWLGDGGSDHITIPVE